MLISIVPAYFIYFVLHIFMFIAGIDNSNLTLIQTNYLEYKKPKNYIQSII